MRASPLRRDGATRPRLGGTEALLHECDEREDAALAFVVRAHDHHEIFHRDDERETPEDQRQETQDGVRVARLKSRGAERFLERVERARSDVAEHDSEGADERGYARGL